MFPKCVNGKHTLSLRQRHSFLVLHALLLHHPNHVRSQISQRSLHESSTINTSSIFAEFAYDGALLPERRDMRRRQKAII